MSVLRGTESNIPRDAERLPKDQAITYQWNEIYNWKPEKEVWPFVYGVNIITGLTGLTAAYVNVYFRERLRLTKYGLFSSYTPVVIIPALCAGVFHKRLISHEVFFNEIDPTTLLVKASLIQSGFGIVYPVLLGSACNFMLAVTYATYRLPTMKEKKESLQFWWRTCRPLFKPLSVLCILQCMSSSFITHKEIKSIEHVRKRLSEFQEKIEKQRQQKLNN